MGNEHRSDYWNKKYVEYWRKVTEEAEEKGVSSSRVKKLSGHDFKSPDIEVITTYFDKLSYSKTDKLLDYGCGFGRFYPYFEARCDYYGIDISTAMIEECIRRWPKQKDRFMVAEGENLPFNDYFFDKIICVGVFDACYQEQALKEMLRVIKPGGVILISGKNDVYFSDDDEAYIAEVNARKKGHPNYFTDVRKLVGQLKGYCSLVDERYALRRGDFGKGQFVYEMPEVFYEWQIILEKTADRNDDFEVFSGEYSRTWIEKNGSIDEKRYDLSGV